MDLPRDVFARTVTLEFMQRSAGQGAVATVPVVSQSVCCLSMCLSTYFGGCSAGRASVERRVERNPDSPREGLRVSGKEPYNSSSCQPATDGVWHEFNPPRNFGWSPIARDRWILQGGTPI